MTVWTKGVLLCDLVLAIVINTSAMLIGGSEIVFQTWYPGTASAFFTNVLLQLLLPVPEWGRKASSPLEGSRWRWLLSVFVENLVFVTCISLTMAVIQCEDWAVVDAWLPSYPYLVLIGYATSLALNVASRLRTDEASCQKPFRKEKS